jgi:hypothetical protein
MSRDNPLWGAPHIHGELLQQLGIDIGGTSVGKYMARGRKPPTQTWRTGTIRRESLDHVIVFNEAALHRHLRWFVECHHGTRTHLSLAKDTPGSGSV